MFCYNKKSFLKKCFKIISGLQKPSKTSGVTSSKTEEDDDRLKDGGAHNTEEQQNGETWRKGLSAADYRQNSGGGTTPKAGEVDAEPG